ncbi:MAG: hypothetical protein ACLUI3_02160 [Christensenellales bacterium]
MKGKGAGDEYLDLAQRKQAEFANYRRRTGHPAEALTRTARGHRPAAPDCG